MIVFRPKTEEEIKELSTKVLAQDLLVGASRAGSLRYVKEAFKRDPKIDILYKNKALIHAAHGGHSKIFKVLVENGADVRCGSNESLRLALIHDYQKLLKILKKHPKVKVPLWKTYRLIVRRVYKTNMGGNLVARSQGSWKVTDVTFVARNREEAMRKAQIFWKNGEFGEGSINVMLDYFETQKKIS